MKSGKKRKVCTHRDCEIARIWDNDKQMTRVLKCVDCLRERRVVEVLKNGWEEL